MLRLLTLSIALLVPGLASAQAWYSAPGNTGRVVEALSPENMRHAFYQGADATTDSGILATGACGAVTILFNSDVAAASGGAEGKIWSCNSNAVSTTTCNYVYSDAGAVSLNGDPSAGRAAIYGIVADWIYFEVTANASTKTYRVHAICEGTK